MNEDLWRKVEEIFHAALGHAPEERKAFVDKSCGGDSALCREVESLLAKEDKPAASSRSPQLGTPRSR